MDLRLNTDKLITVEYFALLREQRGLEEEVIKTTSASARLLYRELQKLHGFDLPEKLLKVAINGEFKSMDAALNEEDRVVFIQPVAGG